MRNSNGFTTEGTENAERRNGFTTKVTKNTKRRRWGA